MARRPFIRGSEETVRFGDAIDGPFALPLDGGRIEQCRLDNAFSLVIEVSGQEWVLRIEGSFSITRADCVMMSFDSDAEPGRWAPAVDALLHASVSYATVAADGSLRCGLRGDVVLHVVPSTAWEAWVLEGPGGQLYVCGPTGRLSRWPGRP